MTMTEIINSLPLPDELCWKVQSYLSSREADAIKEFNEEIVKSELNYDFKYKYRNKFYGKIIIPDSLYNPFEGWYKDNSIKTLQQLCKDNNIKIKGRTKKDVYRALMSI